MTNQSKFPENTLPLSWTALFLLTAGYILSFIDRFAVSVLVEPLVSDIGLTDIEIGLLQGVAFSIFYAVFGVPLGVLSDTINRKLLIIVGMILWSIATLSSGLVSTFAMLFTLRMLVGVGEASLSPAAISIISDAFSKKDVGKALGVYQIGAVAGSGIAFIVVAAIYSFFEEGYGTTIPFLNNMEAWRATFVAIGIPGFLLAALIMIVVKEPQRLVKSDRSPIRDAIGYLSREGRVTFMLIGLYALSACIGYAFVGWTPAYLAREFGLGAGQAGSIFGICILTFGAAGPFAAGYFVDRHTTHKAALNPYKMLAIFYSTIVLGSLLAYSTKFMLLSIIGFTLIAFGFTASFSLVMILIQRMVPGNIRGSIVAVTLLVSSFFGISIGPLIVPVASTYIFASSLQYALMFTVTIMSLFGLLVSATSVGKASLKI